jgi:hypothetical protein
VSRHTAGGQQPLILSALAKVRKSTISFGTSLCPSVCLSVCLSFLLSLCTPETMQLPLDIFIGVILLCCSITKRIVQSKHNNIFNNVKLPTSFGYSNHHQADISVHAHDMFSAYSVGSHIVYICCVEFQICSKIHVIEYMVLF